MTSRVFLAIMFGSCISFISLFVLWQWTLNDFGLWRSEPERRIYSFEKTSKYLFAHRYIPENFDGLLIGPSISTNIDTRKFMPHKIYNLSMDGANVTELKAVYDKAQESKDFATIIICLYPYMTQNSGMKGQQIHPKEYLGSLFSMLPVWLQRWKWHRQAQAHAGAHDPYAQSEWGFIDSRWHRPDDFALFAASKKFNSTIHIDNTAYKELAALIDSMQTTGARVIAYYYPIYHPWWQVWQDSGAWTNYTQKMNALFHQDATIVDMNNDAYSHIHSNLANYADGHLTPVGARMVEGEIMKIIEK